jgi:tape measure domain-containing protein
MAEYNINFSTNAPQISKELGKLQAALTKAVQMAKPGGLQIKLDLDTSGLEASIDTTFRKINKAIESNQRKLSRLQVGGAGFRTIAERLGTAEGLRERGQAIAEPIKLRAQAAAFESGSFVSMQKELQALRIEASQITPNTVEWVRFQQQIGEVNLQLNKADKAAESIQLTQELGALAPGSLSRLEKQLTILKNRAREISPDGLEWKKLNKEIQNIETSIAKVNKKPMTMGQRAGAAGGAFLYGGGLGGGPGSALGGIAGGLAGGVPGAFTGAALGQLADNIGQALGATASYTAEIDKQRIALKNVTKDVAEYQGALAFIDQTSRSLAIPQDVLNKQFTQLSASVIGAGGNINLAKEAFIGIAAGIRGTGGSLADMEGALRATAQVFSKGKVSAEELRQQIGERLPGAFTLFAKSMGKTPQELDKMLEQGQVTLNHFMGFVRTLSREHSASASEMGASSQAAGDRLATTMSRMRESVGRELQPLGAQFQEILANAVAGNEENLVALAKAFSEAAQAIGRFIEQYGGLIASLGSTILLFGGTALAIKGIAVAFAAIGPAISTAAAAIASYGGVLSVLKLAMAGLGGPITLTIAGLALLSKGVYDTNETFRNFVDNIDGVIASDFKNAVDGMAEDAKSSASNIQTAYTDLTKKLEPVGQFIEQLFKDVFKSTSDSAETSATASSNSFNQFFSELSISATEGFNGLNAIISNWWSGLPAPIRNIFGGNAASMLVGAAGYVAALPGRTSTPNAQSTGMYGRYGSPDTQVPIPKGNAMDTPIGSFVGGSGSGGSSGRKKKGTDDAKKLREEMARQAAAAADALFSEEQRLLVLQQTNPIAEAIAKYTSEEASIQRELNAGLKEAKSEKEKIDLKEAARLKSAANRLGLERSLNDEADKALKPITDLLAIQREELALTAETEKLMKEGISPERAKQIAEVRQLVNKQLEALNLSIDQAEAAIIEAKARGESTKAVDALIAALDRLKEKKREGEEEGRKGEEGVPKDKPKDYLGEGLKAAQDKLAELSDTGYQVVQAANAIGDAFGNAFKGVIDGSMTAREALAGMFQSIADHFTDMVAQMVAEWLKAQVIKGFMNIFSMLIPGGAAATSAGSLEGATGDFFVPMPGDILPAANGAVWKGGFQAFANGGMVTGPTMGLVGEGRYNEAIVPLPNGKSIPVELGGASQGNVNVVVNVDAKGSQVEGNEAQSKQLGRVVSAAVQAEIVKQQRPGGLLSSSRSF